MGSRRAGRADSSKAGAIQPTRAGRLSQYGVQVQVRARWQRQYRAYSRPPAPPPASPPLRCTACAPQPSETTSCTIPSKHMGQGAVFSPLAGAGAAASACRTTGAGAGGGRAGRREGKGKEVVSIPPGATSLNATCQTTTCLPKRLTRPATDLRRRWFGQRACHGHGEDQSIVWTMSADEEW